MDLHMPSFYTVQVVVCSHSSMDVCVLLFHYATLVVSYVYFKRFCGGLVLVVLIHVK